MNSFLPVNKADLKKRGIDSVDVILVTGDAYIDHPSFGAALISRYLESLGVTVGIIAAPDIANIKDFTKLGVPNLFFAVTSGNLDSMLMHKTASKKIRNSDDYVPASLKDLRPKRAVISYCNKIRELFKDTQILIGGLEASLRRFAHFDYWDNSVRRSVLLDSRADILVYGMAEAPIKEIIENVRNGRRLKDIKTIRGTAIVLSEKEVTELSNDELIIESFEDIKASGEKYTKASKVIHLNQNPFCAKTLLQKHQNRFVRINPPGLPLNETELDKIYGLNFTRFPHPSYKEKIPAYEMIKYSITSHRGCFGGCSFCSLGLHQGKIIQSRSQVSIVKELNLIKKLKGFTGYVSDIGGATANMYKLTCKNEKKIITCVKTSCLFPKICKNLKTNHSNLISLLKQARELKGIRKIHIGSGVRFDLANLCSDYIKEIAVHHTSGQLKVAPEHTHPEVLAIMQKPEILEYEKFKKVFLAESKKCGLNQFIVPYFISSHPGCTLDEQFSLYEYLKQNNIRPRQVQEFIPLPMTLASDMYYTGINPLTGKKLEVVKGKDERLNQKILMFYYKEENKRTVRKIFSKLKK